MLSKNNKKQYDLKHANGRQHFSLRKTTLGLASVLLSTTLYLGGNSGQLVHAAEDTNSTTVSSNADAISTEEAKTTSVDKSALQNAYDNALNVQKSDVKYTNETDSTKKSAYDSAVANAKSVLDNASATSEDVTNAVNELNTAYNSLTGVANTTTTANDTTKTGAGLYSDEDKAKEQASNLTTESSTISRKLCTDFLKKYNVTNGDRYQVDPKGSGVFSSGNIDKWHDAVNTKNNKYYNASATGNITITQADYNQNDNTITWTVTFNPNNGVSYSGSGSPAGTGAGGSGSGSFSTATSVYAISISKDLAVQSIKYGWNTLTDATENYNKSQASQSAVAITSSETNNAANEMTVTSGETTAYNSFKKALVSGPLFNYISNGDIGTNITFDPYQNGKTANSKKNSVGFTVQITTSVDTNNLGAFTGLVAGESYITPYLYSQMGDNAFKTPRVLGVYRAANITVTNKGTEGITSEAIPVKVTYNGSETVPSDVTSITYTINKNADNLKKVNASKYANATNDSIQVTTNDWNKGYYDTESVSYPYYYDTNTLKDDLLNSNALSLSNISVNGSSSKIYNTSTSIQNGALVINITAWDQPATGKEITVEKGTTLTPDLVAEKSISNYKQLKAEGYTFSFKNDVDTSKEGTGNYGLLIKYPDYTEANKHNSVQSITVHVTDSNLDNAKKAANDAIDKLNNLNDAQKAIAKAAVKAATTVDAVTAAQTNATTTDTNMGNLSNDDNYKSAESIKQGSNYKNADTDLKKAYDDAVNEAKALLDKSTGTSTGDVSKDPVAVEAAKKKVDEALAALNGDSNLAKAKEEAKKAINQMGDLSDADKEAAKANVDKATEISNVNTAKSDAQDLNDAKKAAKEAIEQMSDLSDADKTAAKSNVDNATNIAGVNTAKQDAQDLNNAKKAAKEAIEQMGNLSDADKTAAKSNVDNATDIAGVNTAKQDAQDLNNAKKAAKEAIEQMSDLSDADKTAAKSNVDNATDIAGVNTAKQDAQDLNNAKKAAKEAIEQMSDLSDADKTAAKSNVDNATDIAGVNTAKQDAQDLNDAKKTAKEAINKLTNLNKAQKEAAIAQVNAAETVAEIQPIVETATALDGKMGDLKKAIEAADAKKSTTAYTQASDTKDFDDALTAANTLNSDKGDNEDAAAVQAKIDALTNAKLDGDKQLQDAKDAAIAKINALENLNKAQKQAAIEAVNNATTVAEIQPIVDTVTTLDGKMGDLKKAIEAADAKKSTTAYTQASDTKDFDDALTAVNTLNSDNGDNEGAEAVQAKIDALNNAKLNGERIALQKAVEVAIAKIEGINPDYIYYNSDSELQSAFKEAVAKGKILLEQRDASDENYQLAREAIEAAMKALNGQLTDKTALQTSVSQSGEVHKSVAYLNASEAAKKAYDDALANAEAVLADKNATQADVDAALAKLNAALQKLDGKESPAKPTVKKNTVKLGTNADRLPQTGSHESVASEVGLGILALGLAALGLVKKRKED
ncbi:YSIRK-type signal peptide-containing protein [Lactobacillus jensenii]|nr:YSIRK-type signal peptide-containing protein [Lactobacillus jensenii]